MPPHTLAMTLIGAALLWVGWFGFNAGSNLEANGGTALAMINTFVATAGAALGWLAIEWMRKGTAVAARRGLGRGRRPRRGHAGGRLRRADGRDRARGRSRGVVCYFFCSTVKHAFGYDDSLDVFGIHGVGGIIGSIVTGVLVSPALGGVGLDGYAMGHQVSVQFVAVAIAVGWCAVASFVLYKLVDMLVGLRVAPEAEREGLDLAEHGERAYTM